MDALGLLERVFGWGGVLAYHGVGTEVHAPVMHVTPERLRAQLLYLRDEFECVRLSTLVERWRAGKSTRGLVAVTFDDAYAGVGELAAPVLRDLGVPATIFVTSGTARAGSPYWWDAAELDRLSATGEWSDVPAAVGLGALPRTPESMNAVREAVLGNHAGRWPASDAAQDPGGVWRSHTFDELRALAAADDLFDFGVHTVTHPALPLLGRSEQVHELRECLRALEAELPASRVLPVVAYPYGLYDGVTIAAAREAGMTAGMSIEGRATGAHPHLYRVPRVGAGDLQAPAVLRRKLNRGLRAAFVLRNGGVHPRIPRPVRAVG